MYISTHAPNGLRKPRTFFAGYWRWGGRGLCLGAEKTRSQCLDTAALVDNQKMLDAKRGDHEASHLPKRSEGVHALLLE